MFGEISCFHCKKVIIFPGGINIFDSIVKCPYDSCFKSFEKRNCKSCKRTQKYELINFFLNYDVNKCYYIDCNNYDFTYRIKCINSQVSECPIQPKNSNSIEVNINAIPEFNHLYLEDEHNFNKQSYPSQNNLIQNIIDYKRNIECNENASYYSDDVSSDNGYDYITNYGYDNYDDSFYDSQLPSKYANLHKQLDNYFEEEEKNMYISEIIDLKEDNLKEKLINSDKEKSDKIEDEKDNNDLSNCCIICLDKLKDTLFLPCKHLVCCSECSDKIFKNDNNKKCPVCTANIENKIDKIYF